MTAFDEGWGLYAENPLVAHDTGQRGTEWGSGDMGGVGMNGDLEWLYSDSNQSDKRLGRGAGTGNHTGLEQTPRPLSDPQRTRCML